ncbi:unnamed protein product [Amaranthus hypochondriacus]
MDTHFNAFNKYPSQYQQHHSSDYHYFQGKLRKFAVRTFPTILSPKNSELKYDGKSKKWKKSGKKRFISTKSLKQSIGGIDIVEERKKIRKLFWKEYESLKHHQRGVPSVRLDLQAWNRVKESVKLLMLDKEIGPIPGVEIEDVFDFRLELKIMGIHSHIVRGIDYTKCNSMKKYIAVSIVATEGYDDMMMKADELIYSGEGGKSESKCQELKMGNLALRNSIEENNYVRVVRGIKCREKRKINFVYDGLYKVIKFDEVIGSKGCLKFVFTLKRCSGQKSIVWAKYR